MELAFERMSAMFGMNNLPLISSQTLYYARSYIGVFIIAIIGATPFVKSLVVKLKSSEKINKVINILEPVVQVVLLTVITAYLIDGSFNPFLYFRF